MSTVAVEMLPIARRFSRDPSRPKPRACRNLFGKPDKGEIDRLLSSEMSRIRAQDNNRYNFDFDNDTPLDGKYEWSTSDVKDIPSMYRPITVCAQGKRLPMRTTSRLAAEPTNSAPESVERRPVQSANESTVPALPTGRLQGPSSSCTPAQSPQSAAAVRTHTQIDELFATSSSSKSTTTKAKGKSRQRRSAPASNQPKITEFLQVRKRSSAGEVLQEDSKRRRMAESNSLSTPPSSHSQS